jgi:hypothetical protein
MAQPEPLTYIKSRIETEDPIGPTADEKDWIELLVGAEDVEPANATDSSGFSFADIACACCGTAGSVMEELPDETICPRCKKDTLRYVNSWIA